MDITHCKWRHGYRRFHTEYGGGFSFTVRPKVFSYQSEHGNQMAFWGRKSMILEVLTSFWIRNPAYTVLSIIIWNKHLWNGGHHIWVSSWWCIWPPFGNPEKSTSQKKIFEINREKPFFLRKRPPFQNPLDTPGHHFKSLLNLPQQC
jgi:hypothetical protein